MAAKITRDIIESYLNCKFKGHLKLTGQSGTLSDYEALATAASALSREQALTRLAARFGEEAAGRGTVTAALLKQRAPFLLDASLEGDGFSLRLDGLKRVDGASELGDHHYLPVLHVHGDKVGRREKTLLALAGLAVAGVQGLRPAVGLVSRGPEARLGKVRLDPKLYRKAEQVLDEVNRLQVGGEPPRLMLNGHCQRCEFRQRCRKQAEEADDLSLLGGITTREIVAQNQKGIFTVNQLSYTFRHRKPSKRAKHPSNPHHFALQALALRTKKVHVHGAPALPAAETEVYYDIEGLPGGDFYYLIGAAVVQKGEPRLHSFWADSTSDQTAIFLQFVDLVAGLPGCKLFHFGRYDADAVRKAAGNNPHLSAEVERILSESTDVLRLVHSHIYFPTYSSSLKEIASFLAFRWSEAAASGAQTIVWRERWELSRDPSLKETLIRYNREDCLALKVVCDFVRTAIDARPVNPGGSGNELVVNTKDIAKSRRRWVEYGRPTFLLADLERASNCAHFDYQRERVFARTDKKVARITRQRRRRATVGNPYQNVEIGCEACTLCGGKNIRPTTPVHRRVADLQFSRAGVKKCVRRYSSWRFFCADCKKTFLPAAWPRYRGIYGDQLAVWCVYQNIRGRQTMCQVTESLSELFALDIGPDQANRFKKRIGAWYSALYDQIRQRIVTSAVLHIDEGDVAIRKTKGYVWVFATLDSIWYLYKDTRSGEFLKELLSGFSGVLVSDFYNAYDAINCPQQKCLLHLLRDINEDLKKNPFDDDLKSIAQRFGVVLRSIVETLDKYGMRKRHLHKHNKHVEGLVNYVSTHAFTSEVALGYQKRFKKVGSKLFTFLDHDNVPWNNTCAEHAVKNFMKFKRTADGLFSERSIQEALVLLSVVQTCKLNGVNVLKFLLSKRTDINAILGLKPE
jgi:predicted RecB family nuclease